MIPRPSWVDALANLVTIASAIFWLTQAILARRDRRKWRALLKSYRYAQFMESERRNSRPALEGSGLLKRS